MDKPRANLLNLLHTMSTISKDDVLKLATLARLNLTKEEVEKYQKELGSIFEYVEKLQTIDTEGVEPTYQVHGLNNVTRNDELIDYKTSQKELLKNVPKTEGPLIKVERMIG